MLTFEKMRPEEQGTCAALAARAFGNYEYFTYYQKNGFEEFDQRFFNRKGKQLGSWSYRISI